MSDIFISYSRSDQKWVKMLAAAFEEHGYDVWWDTELLAGDDFHHVIPEELEKAKCVIVVWSKASVTRKWVRAEVSRGDQRDVLVPILMESDVKVPMPFNMLQAEDMTCWNGNSNHPLFEHLLLAVNQYCKKPPAALIKKKITQLHKYGIIALLILISGFWFSKSAIKSSSNAAMDFEKVTTLLNKIDSGQLSPSKAEQLEILQKIQDIVTQDSLILKLKGFDYQPRKICPAIGRYEHYIVTGDTMFTIMKDCAYGVADLSVFDKENILKSEDILIIDVDNERLVTNISLKRLNSDPINIYSRSPK